MTTDVDRLREARCLTCGAVAFDPSAGACGECGAEDRFVGSQWLTVPRDQRPLEAAAPVADETQDHALHYDPDCEECVYLARTVMVARPAPAEVTGHGPWGNEVYCRCGVFVGHTGDWSQHRIIGIRSALDARDDVVTPNMDAAMTPSLQPTGEHNVLPDGYCPDCMNRDTMDQHPEAPAPVEYAALSPDKAEARQDCEPGYNYDDHDWNSNGSPSFCRRCRIEFPDWNRHPAAPVADETGTETGARPDGPWTGDPADYDGDEGR